MLTACPGGGPPDTPPATPTGLTVKPGDAEVNLTWNANTAENLQEYTLYRGASTSSLDVLESVPKGTQTFTDTGLDNGTTYFYAIDAVDAAGKRSARSAPVSATPQTEEPTDTVPPTVSATNPANGDTGVAVNTSISLTFSEVMNEAATEAALSFDPAVTCAFTWNAASTVLSCQPSANLAASTSYSVSLATGAQDVAGNALTEVFSFAFTTGDEADTIPPTVVSSDPANGDTEVALNAAIVVTFSEAMNRESVEMAFESSPEINCDFSWNFFATSLICKPQSSLAAGATYEITIGTGAKDAASNALAEAFTFSFTTREADTTPPTVVATDPTEGDPDVAINDAITITFSETMNEAATQGAFSTNPAITCDFSWNSNSTALTCRPQSNLTENITYSVTIGIGAKDIAGNALSEVFTFSFMTGTTELQVCVFGDLDSIFGNCVFGP